MAAQKINVEEIRDLRTKLVDMFNKTQQGKMKLKDLKELTNNVGKALSTYKIEMEANRHNKEFGLDNETP